MKKNESAKIMYDQLYPDQRKIIFDEIIPFNYGKNDYHLYSWDKLTPIIKKDIQFVKSQIFERFYKITTEKERILKVLNNAERFLRHLKNDKNISSSIMLENEKLYDQVFELMHEVGGTKHEVMDIIGFKENTAIVEYSYRK